MADTGVKGVIGVTGREASSSGDRGSGISELPNLDGMLLAGDAVVGVKLASGRRPIS